MGSPLGPTLANALICFYETFDCGQNNVLGEFKPVYYRRWVDNIFVLFRSHGHLIIFRDYINKCHANIKFSFKEESCVF